MKKNVQNLYTEIHKCDREMTNLNKYRDRPCSWTAKHTASQNDYKFKAKTIKPPVGISPIFVILHILRSKCINSHKKEDLFSFNFLTNSSIIVALCQALFSVLYKYEFM